VEWFVIFKNYSIRMVQELVIKCLPGRYGEPSRNCETISRQTGVILST